MTRLMLLLVSIIQVMTSCAEERKYSVPDYDCTRKGCVIDTCGAFNIKVYSEADFLKAVSAESVIFDIQNDIEISKTVCLSDRKTYCIKGNGSSLSEKGFKQNVFSAPVKALRWTVDTLNKTATFYIPEAATRFNGISLENTFVNYEAWFLRFRGKLIGVTDSTVICACDDERLKNNGYHKRTPQPYLFLETVPSKTNPFTIIKINKGARVLIENTSFENTSSLCIHNKGILKVADCSFYNIDKGCITSSGELFVTNSMFSSITSTAISTAPQSYLEVINSTFSEIGMRGSNNACIKAHGISYIADNTFRDFNYSAIGVGRINCETEDDLPSAWIEHNVMYWTESWNEKMKQYGLRDGGAISVTTNNKQCVIKNNTILNFGGHGSNRAVFCDDGAYNVAIFGNVISGTQNSYDIDSRDCTKHNSRTIPKTSVLNYNNFIGYNICSGYVRFQGNPSVTDNKCICTDNINAGMTSRYGNVISNTAGSTPVINNPEGGIDSYGKVHLKSIKLPYKITAPIIKNNK